MGTIMSVFKDGNSWAYKGKIAIPFEPGKYKSYYKRGFSKKKDAQRAEQLFRDNFSTHQKDITFDELVNLYRANYRTQNVKESTLIGDESYYRLHIQPVLGKYPLSQVTTQAIDLWKSYMIKKPKTERKKNKNEYYSTATINHAKSVISKYLSYAVRLGFISYNPCHNVPSYQNKEELKEKQEIKFWEVNEFKTFIASVDEKRWNDIFTFLFFIGLRESETFALSWRDVDFQKCTLRINKSITYKTKAAPWKITTPKNENSIRIIDLQDTLLDRLKNRLEKEKHKDGFTLDYFIFGDIKPVSRSDLARKMDYFIQLSGVSRITPHGLRHSHASFLIKSKIDDSLIAERLGHTVAELRKTYAHIYDSMRQDMKRILDETCKIE